jgi:hypothetical protein
VTLAELSRSLQSKLHIQTLRVEGDPNLSISHVAFLPGSSGLEKQVFALRQPAVEVLIAGEAGEWETVESLAQRSIPGSSDTWCPSRISALGLPCATASRTYPVANSPR